MLSLNGKTYNVPGVYGTIEVILLGSTTLPAFNNLLQVGNARQGIPYSAGKGNEVFKGFTSVSEAKKVFGTCDITKAFEQAQLGGAGTGFLTTVAPLTQAKAPIKDAQATPQTIFELASVLYGSIGNDHYLVFDKETNNLTVTITPVKRCKHIVTDIASATKIIALEDVEGLQLGEDIVVTHNGTTGTYIAGKIQYIDAVTNKITIDTEISALTKANYGRVFTQDIYKKFTKTFDLTDVNVLDKIISWINATGVFTATRGANTGDITQIADQSNYVSAFTGATKGTSPVATTTSGGDYDTFADSLAQKLEEFTNGTGLRMRLINVIDPTASVHLKFKAIAQVLRGLKYSVQIITGVGITGGTLDENLATSEDNFPFTRTKAINTDDVILACMGLDDKPAYLTLAPQVAGIMSSASVKRNLTGDTISATKVNKFFGEFNAETETSIWLTNGCLIVGTNKDGFAIVQGINTYQKQDTIWNEEDDKTYLIQQRQLADYVFETYRNEMQSGVGADSFDELTARSKGIKALDNLLNAGFITERKIANVVITGNSITTYPSVKLLQGKDFIGFNLSIIAE